MMEQPPIIESQENISRQQVIDSYKKFVARGIRHPDALDLNDPEAIEANDLFYRWGQQEDMRTEGDEDAQLRSNFEKTMLYVDTGFDDPVYLAEILDWLSKMRITPRKTVITRLEFSYDMIWQRRW